MFGATGVCTIGVGPGGRMANSAYFDVAKVPI